MADNEKTTRIVFDGTATGLVAATNQAKGALTSVEAAMGKITSVAGIVAGVLAGGAMFKAAIDETVKWNSEAIKLARTLGITTEQASILNIAMGDIYMSSEDLISATSMMTRNLRSNEDAFNNLGVKTRDSNNHYRSSVDIMTDVNTKLASLKEGTDRNAAGMAVYGRSWQEISNIVKLNAQAMADAEAKARELNLIVGPEGVAQTLAYKAAMNDMNDVLSSLKIQVGNQLLPILTTLGQWFSSIGPETLLVMGGALKGLLTFIMGLVEGLNVLGTAVITILKQIWEASVTAGTVYQNAITGHFGAAIAAARTGWNEINRLGAEGIDNIQKSAMITGKLMADMWFPKQQGKTATRIGGSTGTYTEPDKKDKYDADKVAQEMRLDYYTHEIARIKLLEDARIEEQNQNTDFALKRIEMERSTAQSIAQITAETLAEKQQNDGDEKAAIETMHQYKLQMLEEEYQEKLWYARQTGTDVEMIEREHYARMKQMQQKKELDDKAAEDRLRMLKLNAAKDTTSGIMNLTNALYMFSGQKSRALFELNRVSGYANAVVNTAVGATQALRSVPYPYNLFAMASVIAAGLVQIATISNSSFDGGGQPAAAGGYGGGTPQSPVVTQPVNQQEPTMSVTVVLNNAIGEKRWFEENIPPILRDMRSRNVDIGFATT